MEMRKVDEEEKRDVLCVRSMFCGNAEFKWWQAVYCEDPGETVTDCVLLSGDPPPTPATHFYLGSVPAVVGSVVYLLGGLCFRRHDCPDRGDEEDYYHHRDVVSYDFAEPDKGWVCCPPMHAARSHSSAHVVDGKIYVFGGCFPDTPFAEYFDLHNQKWNVLQLNINKLELPSLSRFRCIHGGVFEPTRTENSGRGRKKEKSTKWILLSPFSPPHLYAYEVESAKLILVDSDFDPESTSIALVHNRFLCSAYTTRAPVHMFLNAYDLQLTRTFLLCLWVRSHNVQISPL